MKWSLRICRLSSQNHHFSRTDDAAVISDANNLVSNRTVQPKDGAVISLGEVDKVRLIIEEEIALLRSKSLALSRCYSSGARRWMMSTPLGGLQGL